MSSHFNLKSLMFYGVAIASVTTLFFFASAYGEANLKAPDKIDGRYQFSTQKPLACLKSDKLLLLLQQSGVYLTGSLLPVDAADKQVRNAEERPLLTGHLEKQQITLQGRMNGCPDAISLQATVQGTAQKGKIDQAKLIGTLQLAAIATPFTAEQEAAPPPSEKQGH